MSKLLITNAGYGHTLSIIRNMAKDGIEIIAADTGKLACSCYSRYVKKCYTYTSPSKNEEKFISDLIEIIKKEKPDVFLPVSTETTVIVSKHKDKLKDLVKVPIADYDQMLTAHDKFKSIKLAEETGVPYPKTFILDSLDSLDKILNELGLPVIIKARLGTGIFARVNSKKEAIEKIKEFENVRCIKGVIEGKNPLIQEFIPGQIHDACVLFNKGKLRAVLTQKRLRTLPINGGPGILNETTNEPELIRYAEKLLSKINYHGPGLVEFMIDERDKKPKLLEINPKLWGTSNMSIAAGINFPLLAFKMAVEGDIKPVWNYKVGIRHKWPIPNGILYLKQSKNKIRDGLDLFNCFGKKNHCGLSIKDPLPDFFQISRMIIREIFPKKFNQWIENKFKKN